MKPKRWQWSKMWSTNGDLTWFNYMLIQERFGAQSGLTDEQNVDNTWCNMSLTFAIQLSKKISQKWPSPYKWQKNDFEHIIVWVETSISHHLPPRPPRKDPKRVPGLRPRWSGQRTYRKPLAEARWWCVLRAIWGQNMMLQLQSYRNGGVPSMGVAKMVGLWGNIPFRWMSWE